LAENSLAARFSKELVNQRRLRSSRVGGWRIILEIPDKETVLVLLVERRGPVYQRKPIAR
jgi:mRNA-degrading endonuclease RelE of RelBE toxin-antitoxin system